MKKTMCVLLAAAVLTACAKTPDNVKSKDSSQHQPTESSQSISDTGSESVPRSETKTISRTVTEADFAKRIESSRDIILSGKYDNLKTDNGFKVIANAYPSIISAAVPGDFEKNADSIFSQLLPDDTKGCYPDKKKLRTDPESGNKTCEYTNGKSIGYVNSDGITAFVDKDYMGKAEFGTQSTVNETRSLIMPVSNGSISLGSQKLDMCDMQKAADEKLRFIGYVNKDVTVRPYSVSTVTEPSGEVLAFMRYRRYYDDLPVFDSVPLKGDLPEMPLMFGSVITFSPNGRIVQLNTGHILDIVEKTKPAEIITPEYAFESASKALAPHIDHTARFEELVLLPTVENDQGNAHTELKQGDVLTLKPYWIIHFETDWWKEVYAAVNAETGETAYVNNKS